MLASVVQVPGVPDGVPNAELLFPPTAKIRSRALVAVTLADTLETEVNDKAAWLSTVVVIPDHSCAEQSRLFPPATDTVVPGVATCPA